MKKSIILWLLVISLVLWSLPVQAAPPDYSGGVNNENEYVEVVFLSGEPVQFSSRAGKFTIKESEKGDSKTISYTFKLQSETPGVIGSLDRTVKFEVTYQPDTVRGQTIANLELKSYKETIKIGADTYTLKKDTGYQFSRSDIIDNRPASDFYSGNIKARKYYDINKNQGTAVVDISGGTVGYENFWGSTETLLLDYYIQVERVGTGSPNGENIAWEGQVTASVADSMNKSLKYAENEVNLSSFPGGNMKVTRRNMYSRYDYNLPRMSEGKPAAARRQGTVELNQEMLPRVERLIVPKFRDVGGHWAQEDIEKLFSLDVFAGNPAFFLPDVPMTRADFVRAVVKACDMRVSDQAEKKTRSRRAPAEVSPFADVAVTDPDYPLIKQAVNKGLVSGSGGYFMPNEPLNRAQAIAILVRALGFESKAPTPGYSTSFVDDGQIPYWARDSIYVAAEIGLVSGDQGNRINSSQVMTRAEASSMLVRFLNFLEKDLQKDYRENILLYR